jgi:hypothetical protein
MRRILTLRGDGLRHLAMFVVAPVAVVTIAGISGMAYAYWTSTGSGSAVASAGTMETVTIEALAGGDTPSGRLYPGGPAGDVVIKVHNPNPFSVSVVSVTGNGTITGVGGTGTCSTTGVTFDLADVASITPSPTLAASSSTLLHLPAAASMSLASDDGCQGATFEIPVTLTVQR